MYERDDLTGKKYDKLTVIKFSKRVRNSIVYECRCRCGKRLDVYASNLRSGNTKGCQSCAKTIHGKASHPLYIRWRTMAKDGRLCEEWLDIEKFLVDVESTYTEGAYLRRANTSKPHSFDNSFWVKPRVKPNVKSEKVYFEVSTLKN